MCLVYLFLVLLCFCLLWFLFCFLFFFRHRDGCIGPCKGPPTVRPLLVHLFTKMTEFSTALINGQHAACNSVLIDLAKAKRRWTEKKSTQLFSTWMFVSSCGLMVSSELLKQLGAFRASCRNPKNRIATRSCGFGAPVFGLACY